MSKVCTKCSIEKPFSEFPPRGKAYHSWCRQCSRDYHNTHYAYRPERIAAVVARRERIITENRKVVLDYLLSHPCEHCGETDPIVLDFDHVDVSQKLSSISQLKSHGYAKQKLLDEMQKCRVLCANCHRRHTYKQRNFQSYKIVDEKISQLD